MKNTGIHCGPSVCKAYTIDQDKAEHPENTVKKAVDALKRISAVKCDTPLGGLFQNAELPVDATCSMRFSADLFKSSGKGLSPAQCRASAVMEYVERYSWLHFNYRKAKGFIQASYNDLKNTHPTVHPDYFTCNLVQPKDPEYLTARISSLPMKWINAVSMKDGTPFLYPLNWHNYVLGSNGLAAGNNRHEAMLQALCEVVERENIYRFFGEARPAPVLDPSSVSHPGSLRLMAQADKAGIELITRYIGFDFGIPTFIVRGVFRAHPESLCYKGVGQGTHPDPEKALIRALTEYFEGMSQTRDMEKKLLKTAGTHNAAGKKLNWQQFLANHSRPMHGGFIANYRPDMMTRAAGTVSMKDIANLSHGDIRVELNRLADILAGHGHDIYVVDKIHPELDIPVVRIFSPKMRSLINSEIYDPFRAMAAVCHEAGNTRERDIFWRMHGMNSTNGKSPGTSPPTCFLIPPSSNAGHGIWGEDYRKTLLQAALSRRHLM